MVTGRDGAEMGESARERGDGTGELGEGWVGLCPGKEVSAWT